MDQQMPEKRKRKGLVVALVILGMILLLAGGIYGFLFHFGGFRIDMTLAGEKDMILRYGDSFEDPGLDAYFRGDYLIKSGRRLAVTTEGEVDDTRIGTYEITFRAEYGFWKNAVTRKVHVVDRVKPRILLIGDPGAYALPGEGYYEEGYLAKDNYDGDITDLVEVTKYHNKWIYSVTDSSGNYTEAVREIVYYDPVHPMITLLGDTEITLEAGTKFQEPGYKASDNLDGDLTDFVQVSGKVNYYQAGTYTLTYSVKDNFGNESTASRIIRITGSSQPEIVTPTGKVIYLTFDDGPGPYTRQLLDVLKKYNVKATFFVISTKYFDVVKDIVNEGHSIGIHCYTHDYKKIYASEDAYFKDLHKIQNKIEEYTGVRTTLVRFPGGSSNTASRFNKGIMTRLAKSLNDMGYQYFDWNVDSYDAGGAKDSDSVVELVTRGVQEQKVSIVLQHDIKQFSVEAVEEIIVWALNHGYRFLPLDPTSPNAHHGIQN